MSPKAINISSDPGDNKHPKPWRIFHVFVLVTCQQQLKRNKSSREGVESRQIDSKANANYIKLRKQCLNYHQLNHRVHVCLLLLRTDGDITARARS